MQKKSNKNFIDRLHTKLKSNPLVAIVIFIFAMLVSLASFTDSIDKINTFYKKYFSNQQFNETAKELPQLQGNKQLSNEQRKLKSQAMLMILSDPPGADVFLDWKHLGTTPVSIEKIEWIDSGSGLGL